MYYNKKRETRQNMGKCTKTIRETTEGFVKNRGRFVKKRVKIGKKRKKVGKSGNLGRRAGWALVGGRKVCYEGKQKAGTGQ